LKKEDAPFQLASYVTGFDGVDYHYWIKDKLEDIASKLNLHDFKLSIDAQPVLERDLAYKQRLDGLEKTLCLYLNNMAVIFLLVLFF
jgi:epoxyqueuosine reductase